MSNEKEILNNLKKRKKITEDTCYQIPSDWYNLWKKHLKGGESPGTFKIQKIEKNQLEKIHSSHPRDKFLTFSEFSILNSKYNKELLLQHSDESEAEESNLCETPKASPADLKFSRNFKPLTSMTKPATYDNNFASMSTTPSFKRSFSTLNTIIKQRSKCRGKITFWCEGNYSMLNSCLQVFFSISQLSEFFIDRYFSGNFISRPLSSSFAQMFLTRTMLKSGKIDTSAIRDYLVHNFPQTTELCFTQLFRLIIDELIEEYEENDYLVKSVFNGRVLRETTCLACDFKKEEEENFNDLGLEVCKTLDRSFEIFNREDRIMSFCTNCNEFTNTSQRNTIVQTPTFLVLHLKRFVQSPYLHKNNLITDINKKLVMNEEKFVLKGMVFHEGEINSGEYLLYSKVNSKWYLYKGKKACKVSQDDVLSLPGLIYIYEKEHF